MTTLKIDKELLEKQLMCADYGMEYFIHHYDFNIIDDIFKKIDKSKFILEYGVEGVEIIYNLRIKDWIAHKQSLKNNPERWV